MRVGTDSSAASGNTQRLRAGTGAHELKMTQSEH